LKVETNWKMYQKQAAKFFTELGLSATEEKEIQGVRGKHKVDVFVTGIVHGLDIKWIIECKQWSSNVPKEKVLALLSIVQDIGADKGILLSEVGFQSGAIRMSRNTNILLTSLADLREEIKDTLVETLISTLHWRLTKVSKKLSALHRLEKDKYFITPALKEKMKIFFLDTAFEGAIAGEYPNIYAVGLNDTRLVANSFDELIREANRLITDAETFASTYQPNEHEDLAGNISEGG